MLCRLLRPDPEVAEQVADVAAAQRDEPGDDDEREAQDRREAPPRDVRPPEPERERDDRGEPEADRARGRAGEDQPDAARDGGGDPPAGVASCRHRQQEQRHARHGSRQPGEVVVAEERRLPPAARPAGQDPPAEELHDRDRARAHAPGDQHREDQLEVGAPPNEDDDGGREQRILGELSRGDEVGVRVVRLVQPARVDDRREAPDEQGRGRDPDPAPGAERGAVPDPDPQCDGCDGEHREVRERHVHARRSDRDGKPRLEANVQEQDRQSRRKHERPRRGERVENGSRASPVGGSSERSDGHRRPL